MNKNLFTRQYMMIIFDILITVSGFNLLNTILPVYINDLGYNPIFPGILMAVFTFSSLVSRPIFNRIMAHKSSRFVLLFGHSMILAAVCIHIISGSIWIIALGRVIVGIGFSAYTTAMGTITAKIVPQHRRGEGMGYYNVAFFVTIAVGPIIGLYLYREMGQTIPFAVAAITVFSSFFISIFMEKVDVGVKIEGKVELIERTSIRAAYMLFFYAFAGGMVLTYIAVYAQEMQVFNIYLFYPAYAIAILLSRMISGKWYDRKGMGPLVAPSIILGFIGMLILSMATNIWMFVLVAVFFAFSYGMIQPTINAVMITLCKADRIAVANTTFYVTMDVGVGLGSFIGGLIIGGLGYGTSFLLLGLFLCLSGPVYLFGLKKQMKVISENNV